MDVEALLRRALSLRDHEPPTESPDKPSVECSDGKSNEQSKKHPSKQPDENRVDYLMQFPFHQILGDWTANILRQSIMAGYENLSQEGRLILKHGERIEMGANLVPQLVNIPKTNFKKICEAPPMTILGPLEDKSKKAPATLPLKVLSELISKLDNHTGPLPLAWKEAHGRLRDLGKEVAQPNERTKAHVLSILEEAREKTFDDMTALFDLWKSSKTGRRALFAPKLQYTHVYVCRLLGIAATNDSKWDDDLEYQIPDGFEDLSARIDYILKCIKKAQQGQLVAGGWPEKARRCLRSVYDSLSFQASDDLLLEEEEWLRQAVEEEIAAGTRGQSREPEETTTA